MRPVIVSGIITGHVPVSYWSIFVLSQKSTQSSLLFVSKLAVYWILILLKRQFKIEIKNKFTLLQKFFPKTKLHNHNNLKRKGVAKFFLISYTCN